MTDLAAQLGGGRVRAITSTSPLAGLAEMALSFPAWRRDAACKETPGVCFFPEQGGDCTEPLAVCGRCLCQPECLAYAMADVTLVGIWGGTTTNERKRMRKGRGSRGSRRRRGEVRFEEG